MVTLTSIEARVLGVLIEKAQTTPNQYPLTVNAMVAGCNQKNNREPVTNLGEDQVRDALNSLKSKGFVREAILTGSRVDKFRHVTREVIEISTSELVILAELMLRGPQTIGELRGRASRMHPLESTDIVKNILDALRGRPEPLVRELPPTPGSGDRATRYAQLLCPDLHPLEAPQESAPAARLSDSSDAADELIQRIQALEAQVAQLRRTVHTIAQALGKPEMIGTPD